MDYEVVIGLEIHAELKTKTKAFCSCKNEFGASINTNICPVCMGLPGALPTINKTCVEYTIKAGLCFGCDINHEAIFERKNYFYPDLSKAYQISQLEKPVCINGAIKYVLDGKEMTCGIDNIHMEEDAGKSIHNEKLNVSLIDYNRCGVPLIEIVTKPDIRSSKQAVAVFEAIRDNLNAIEVSDCKMQEGSIRCDVNVSIHKPNTPFGTRTEMKNLNSFKAVQRAIDYEVERQKQLLKNNERIVQETLKWDDNKGKNFSLRSKEDSNDYRYFPDPDLLRVEIDDEYINEIKATLPELPLERKKRYKEVLNLPDYDIEVLTGNKVVNKFYEDCISLYNNPKSVSNWVMSDIMRRIKDNIEEELTIPVSPKNFVRLIEMFDKKELTINSAREVLDYVWDNDQDIDSAVQELGLKQENNEDLVKSYCEEAIKNNPQAVKDYKNGNQRSLTFFMGQVMKLSKGKANPQMVNKMIVELLNNM